MSELKIKNCPFCGGEAKRFKEYGDERNGYADFVGYRCIGCHVSKGARGDTSKPGYADNSKIEERAIEAWNNRTQPEATKDDSLRTSLADLAMALWRTHYRDDSPNFELLPDAAGILSQIDNMASGLVKPEATKPARDLGAAILAIEYGADYADPCKQWAFDAGFKAALKAAAALASPAQALSAVDIIKTWQERTNWKSDESASKLIFEAAKAEIAELRAALAATLASPEVLKDAERWCMFMKALRTYLPGPAHGTRIKVVEICPMYGEETEVDNLAAMIDLAILQSQGAKNG